MSNDVSNTQRKEVHLDPTVVNALNQMAASMHPPIKVKKLMEMILEEHATGSRRDNDEDGGTPVTATQRTVKAEPMEPGQEPGMLELELQRVAAKQNIKLVKLERQLASNLPTQKYEALMASANEPTSDVRNSICGQLKNRFPNITAVLCNAGQQLEDMSIKVCESHVILSDHLMEYMISYEYGK